MKLDLTIDIQPEDDIYTIQDEIVYKASELLINQVLGNTYNKTEIGEKIEETVIKKLENIMDVNFKKTVSEKVTENLAIKFEKTQQYKLLKADKEIITDNLIKTGLKDLVADIVRSEMKKVFNR
jgi:hypothetical protein